MRKTILTISKFLLAFVFIAIVTCGTLIYSEDLDNPFESAAVAAEQKVTVKVTPQNSRTAAYANILCAYPNSSDNVKFDIEIVLPSGDTKLENNITVKYRTYDITAVAETRFSTTSSITDKPDYTKKSGEHTFYAGSSERKYTVSISVADADFALYSASGQETNKEKNMEWSWTSVAGNYLSRYFGFEVYDVENADIYKDSTTKDYSKSYGMIGYSKGFPYVKFSKYNMNISWYYSNTWRKDLEDTDYLEEDVATPSYIDVKSTSYGSEVSRNVIQSKLAHWYMTGNGKIDGKDLHQDDSYVSLWYLGWKSTTDPKSFKNIMPTSDADDGKYGIVQIEMDGYPDEECFDFSNMFNWKGGHPNNDEMEWSEDSYIYDTMTVSGEYYRCLGDPKQLGIAGSQDDDDAEHRYLYDLVLYLKVVDDTPIYIEDMSIDQSQLTKDDKIRIRVRYSEPVQINNTLIVSSKWGNTSISNSDKITGDTPYLLAYPNGTETSALKFVYEEGAGTDTLVFVYDLEDLEYTKEITYLQVEKFGNGSFICDFSGYTELKQAKFHSGGSSTFKTAYNSYTVGGKTYYLAHQWNMNDSYGKVNSTDSTVKTDSFKLTFNTGCTLDPRIPTIKDIKASSTAISKTHTANISFESGIAGSVKMTVYYLWSENMDSSSATTIRRPSESEYVATVESSGSIYQVTSSQLTGTRFLWVYVKTFFGQIEERLCGPFYFDNSSDDIVNITQIDQYGSTINTDNPSKSKIFQFTVDHSVDYRSASSTRRIDFLWATTSPWSSSTKVVTTDLTNSINNTIYTVGGKTNRAYIEDETTSIKYVSVPEYTYTTTGSLVETSGNANIEWFYKKDSSNAVIYKSYVKSTTYTVELGYIHNNDNTAVLYNDFSLISGEFKKVYLGFETYDTIGNRKDYTNSALFVAGKDYIADDYFHFDTRNVIVPQSVTYPAESSWDYLLDNGVSDSTIRVFDYDNMNDDNKLTIKVKIANTYMPKDKFSKYVENTTAGGTTTKNGSGQINYQIAVHKPNTIYKAKDFVLDKKDGCKFSNRTYVSPYITDTSVAAETNWFSVKLLDSETDAGYYNTFEITFNTDDDSAADLLGYYSISFYINNYTSGVLDQWAVQDIEFFIATGEEETKNLGDNTDDASIYDVYKLDEGTKFYYKDSVGAVNTKYYTTSDSFPLMLSSKEMMAKYLTYMEYQDFYLVKIDANIADDLNGGQNAYYKKANSDSKTTAFANQLWIRYKSVEWTEESSSSKSWVYYYYGDADTDENIDINKLKNLKSAVEMIVDTIISEHGKNYQYTTLDGMDINDVNIHVKPCSVATTITGSSFKNALTFEGDEDLDDETIIEDDEKGGIANGTVLINQVYRLDSNARYYYMLGGASIYESYVENGGLLTMSTEEKMRDYLTYLEYQDMYLWKITNSNDAASLNNNNQYIKATGETKKAAVNQLWIRYKSSAWTDQSSNPSDSKYWVYYYYTDISDITYIDVATLPSSITKAIQTVVATIMSSHGYSALLTGEDNLDEFGSPYIDDEGMKVSSESVTETRSGTPFASDWTWGGDAGIYDSYVMIGDTNYLLASTVILDFGEYTNIYIRPMFGEYQAYFGKVASGRNMVIKDVIDDVYKRIYIDYMKKEKNKDVDASELTDMYAPSGTYEILEIDEYGARKMQVYIDKDAPQLNFKFDQWMLGDNGINYATEASLHSSNARDSVYVINAVSFTLTGLGVVGAYDKINADEEIDKYAYVAIYQTGTLLATYTANDFANNKTVKLKDGKYTLAIYDRSGNNYELTVRVNSTEMEFNVNTDENVYMTIKNRTDDDIREFWVEYDDNKSFDLVFDTKKIYYESGTYVFHIVDWYGNTIEKTVVFQRPIPQVTWKYSYGAGFAVVKDDTDCTKVEKIASKYYKVSTSALVGFSYSSTAGIKYEFLSDAPKVNVSSVKTVSVEQTELSDFIVKLSYVQYPDVYVIYEVIVDNRAPVINISYEQYAFEDADALDVVRQVKSQKDGYFEDGTILTPTRIDYKLLSKTTRVISSGSYVSTTFAKFSVTDESGIKRIIVTLDGVTLYDGEYNEEGIYKAIVKNEETGKDEEVTLEFNNTFTKYGKYEVIAYDCLGNRNKFMFTNSQDYDVTYYVDGEEIVGDIDFEYKKNSIGQIEVDSQGNPIVDNTWLYVKKFVKTGNEEDEYALVTKGKNTLAQYIRDSQVYTKIEYGNESQMIKLTRDAQIEYLLTDDDGNIYFIGFNYKDSSISFFQYVADSSESVETTYKLNADGTYAVDDNGEYIIESQKTTYTYSVGINKSDSLITFAEASLSKTYTIYKFEDIGVSIVANFDATGAIYLTIAVIDDINKTLTIETKVSSLDSQGYEPAYFKTKLSIMQSDVVVRNVDGQIDTSIAVGTELIYTHGTKIFVLDEEIKSIVDATQFVYEDGVAVSNIGLIKDVQISFSDVFKFTKFYYLYTIDSSISKKKYYDYADGDGYYCIKVTNLYGNEKVYYFAVSNSLLVSTIATYIDGWTREFPTSYIDTMRANKEFLIQFKDGNITYDVTRDGKTYKPAVEREAGSISLFFDEQGKYVVNIVDEYGNVITKTFEIIYNELDLSQDVFTGFDTTKQHRLTNYSNKMISLDGDKLLAAGISYISVQKTNGLEVVLYDTISRVDEKVAYDATKLVNCIGLDGDGIYTISFRDAYGNITKKTVNYRATPTLVLTRMSTTSAREEVYSIEKALDIGFWSNNLLKFTTSSSDYYMLINGAETKCEKRLTFSSDVVDGSITYAIEYYDEYGNEYFFNAYLHRAILDLIPSDSMAVVDIDGVHFTNKKVVMNFSGAGLTCSYTIDGGTESFDYLSGDQLRNDGKYKFTLIDYAGNIANYIIVKDAVVNYVFREGNDGQSIKNGLVAVKDVVFSPLANDTSYIKQVFRNGVLIDFESTTFHDNGKWEVIVADAVGNESYFLFYIINHALNYLDYYAPQNYEITDVWFNDENGRVSMNPYIIVNELGQQHYEFTDDGSYTVVLNSLITGVTFNFSFVLSTEKPTAVLDGVEEGQETIGSVKFKNTVAGDTIYVYRDGKLVDTFDVIYDGETLEISDEGEYRIVIENIAGNIREYTFTRKHVANGAGSALVIIILILASVGLFVGLLYRNRARVDK